MLKEIIIKKFENEDDYTCMVFTDDSMTPIIVTMEKIKQILESL